MISEIASWILDSGNYGIVEEKRNSLLVDFVYQSNRGEDAGTQTKEETNEILSPVLESVSSENKAFNKIEKETINTLKALKFCEDELLEDMERTGMITVQQIQLLHNKLMDGLHPNCGNIRETIAYVDTLDGERYYYPPPEVLENRLYIIVDRHNYHMLKLEQSDFKPREKLEYLIKCAAWFLFNFVDLHPFGDGNGRTCRLLAGYTIRVINLFPVHPYHDKDEQGSRSDYINSIISCRRSKSKGPSLIAALLVDGLYNSWKSII